MARTPTTNIPLGFKAPPFKLPDMISNKDIELNHLVTENGLVVMFICNHCPFVVHVIEQIVSLANDYLGNKIGFVGISSNDIINYPDDSPEKMSEFAKKYHFPFPYLYDESQEIAKSYDAACTPDFYLYDSDLLLLYRGQLDDSRPGNGLSCDGKDISNAIECLINGEENSQIQKPSIGCNIKWK